MKIGTPERKMRIVKLLLVGVLGFSMLVLLMELYGYIRLTPKRNLEKLEVKGVGYFPYEREIPVKRSDSSAYAGGKPDLRIPLHEYIPDSLGRNLNYYKEKRSIRIEIWWEKWSFIAAKESICYDITSSEIHEELLRLIEENQDLFANSDYEKIAHVFANDHANTLRDIGGGNRFRGMQKIGFFDWFRQGKDPEAEWQKKFPAGVEAPEK